MQKFQEIEFKLIRNGIIANYLTEKAQKDYYAVTYRRFFYDESGSDDFEPSFIKPFTREELEKFRHLAAICEKEGIALWEAMDEDQAESEYSFLQHSVDEAQWYLEPISVDINTVYHTYRFKYGYYNNSIDEQPRIINIDIPLTDEEYATLLDWKICYEDAGFTSLRSHHPELFNKLERIFDGLSWSIDTPPIYAPTYVVEMTEVDEDAKHILAKIRD